MIKVKIMSSSSLWISLFGIVLGVIAMDSFHSNKQLDPDVFFAEIMQVAMEARVVADDSGRILYSAPSVSEITGYSQLEMLGQNVEILIPERYLEGHNVKLREAIKRNDGKVVQTRGYLKKKDGQECLVEIRTRVVQGRKERMILATLTPVHVIKEVEIKQ